MPSSYGRCWQGSLVGQVDRRSSLRRRGRSVRVLRHPRRARHIALRQKAEGQAATDTLRWLRRLKPRLVFITQAHTWSGVKAAEKAVTILVLFLLALEVLRNGLTVDTSVVALLVILIFLVLLDSHPDIIRLKAGPGGIEVVRQVRELEQQLEPSPEVRGQAQTEVAEAKTKEEDSTLAFINIWNHIDAELRRIAGETPDSRRPPSSLIDSLRQRRMLDEALLNSLEFLRGIRNRVVHGQLNLDDREASSTVDLAGTVLARLRAIGTSSRHEGEAV